MANITEAVTSINDLMVKLDAYLVLQGWTSDQIDTGAGKWAIHKTGIGDDVYVQARWATASPTVIGLYQSTGFINTSTDPGNHTGDSGNGVISGTNATIATGRHVNVGTPIRYWAYVDTDYVHVVVERQSAGERQFVHFGFGVLSKIGSWTGGSYCYGWLYDTATGAGNRLSCTVLLDGLAATDATSNMQNYVATVRLSGFRNQLASQWAVIQGANSTLGTDRAANARNRVVGGFRGGPIARAFGRLQTQNQKGLMPGYPVMVWYWNTTNNHVEPMGFQKDVRGVNMQFYSPADEITVGSDTWVVFPSHIKYPGSGLAAGSSGYQGIIYRKF